MKAPHPVTIALAFVAIYVIWGTTYLAIFFGLKGFPPFVLSALRFFTAGMLLFIWCKAKGEKLPAINITGICVVSGCLMLIGGSGLVTWGEKYVSSGHAATLIATEPFLFILIDKKRWGSYFKNKLIITGLIIGFLGLALFVHFAGSNAHTIANGRMFVIANIVLVISAVLWVVGSLYAKNKLVSADSNLMTASLQLMAAGVGSALIAACNTEWAKVSVANISITAWGGLIYLVLMGSIVAYLAFTWLISIRPPALVSTHTYINPVVAVLLGWIVAKDQLSFWQVVALFVILAGMFLTNLPGYGDAKNNSLTAEIE